MFTFTSAQVFTPVFEVKVLLSGLSVQEIDCRKESPWKIYIQQKSDTCPQKTLCVLYLTANLILHLNLHVKPSDQGLAASKVNNPN